MILMFVLLGLSARADELLIPDVSPWSHREADGSISGPAGVLGQKLIDRSGVPLQLTAMPIRRIVPYMQDHSSSFAVGFPGGELPSGLIQIGNPIRLPWVAVGRREDGPMTPEHFSSLQKVGVTRGTVILYRDLPALKERPIIEIETVEAGLRMVAAKRLDAFLGRQILIDSFLAKFEDRDLFGDTMYCAEGNTYLVTGMAYKDTPSARAMTEAWNAMIQDGTIWKLLNGAFSSPR